MKRLFFIIQYRIFIIGIFQILSISVSWASLVWAINSQKAADKKLLRRQRSDAAKRPTVQGFFRDFRKSITLPPQNVNTAVDVDNEPGPTDKKSKAKQHLKHIGYFIFLYTFLIFLDIDHFQLL